MTRVNRIRCDFCQIEYPVGTRFYQVAVLPQNPYPGRSGYDVYCTPPNLIKTINTTSTTAAQINATNNTISTVETLIGPSKDMCGTCYDRALSYAKAEASAGA